MLWSNHEYMAAKVCIDCIMMKNSSIITVSYWVYHSPKHEVTGLPSDFIDLPKVCTAYKLDFN